MNQRAVDQNRVRGRKFLDGRAEDGVWDRRPREIVETDATANTTGDRRRRVVNSTWLDHYLEHRNLAKDAERNQILYDVGDWYRETAYRAGVNPYRQRGVPGERVDGTSDREDHDWQHEALSDIRAADAAVKNACQDRGPRWQSVLYHVCVEDYSAREWAIFVAGLRRNGAGLGYLARALEALAGYRGNLVTQGRKKIWHENKSLTMGQKSV